MKKSILSIIALLLLVNVVQAQSGAPVKQSGNVTPGHPAIWATNGVVKDGGTAANGALTSIGITYNGTGFCQNSGPISSAYEQFCWGVTGSGVGTISLNGIGGAPLASLILNLNGNKYSFPYTVGGITGPNSSTVGHLAVWNNTSGSLLADSTTLPNGTTATTQTKGDTSTKVATDAFVLNNIPTTNATTYGVKCDGVTDDTANITTAIAATPVGAALVFPAGSCLVTGSNTAIFTITKAIYIVGQGVRATIFVIGGSVPASTDVFLYKPTAGQGIRGTGFMNVSFTSQFGSAVANNTIRIDTTAGSNAFVAELLIDNIFIDTVAFSGGCAITFDNTGGASAVGGVFNSTISNSLLFGCINLIQTGDTIRIINNLIHNDTTAGITGSQVAGAGQLFISGNNITAGAGMIVLTQASSPVIINNEFEQQVTNTESNNSLIDLQGTVGTIVQPIIFGNSIIAQGGTGSPYLIRLDHTLYGSVDGNYIGTPTFYTGVIFTSNASKTRVGCTNAIVDASPYITDNSTTTVYCGTQTFAGHSLDTQSIAGGNTGYFLYGMSATESLVYSVVNKAGLWKNLAIVTPGAPGTGQTYTFTLRDAASDTTVTCTISGNASNKCSDTTHAASSAGTDTWSIKVTLSATAAALQDIAWAVDFSPLPTH